MIFAVSFLSPAPFFTHLRQAHARGAELPKVRFSSATCSLAQFQCHEQHKAAIGQRSFCLLIFPRPRFITFGSVLEQMIRASCFLGGKRTFYVRADFCVDGKFNFSSLCWKSKNINKQKRFLDAKVFLLFASFVLKLN